MTDELAIEASGLAKRYRGVAALSGIDLRVPPGSVFALLGPNGAGKTTAVRILGTLARADRGQARDGPPGGQPALRVQARGRLVQEDHRRVPGQAGGQVEPAAHAAGVGAHPAPPGLGQVELLEQFGRAPPGRRPRQAG